MLGETPSNAKINRNVNNEIITNIRHEKFDVKIENFRFFDTAMLEFKKTESMQWSLIPVCNELRYISQVECLFAVDICILRFCHLTFRIGHFAKQGGHMRASTALVAEEVDVVAGGGERESFRRPAVRRGGGGAQCSREVTLDDVTLAN